jgi:hypothetical protein
LSVVGWLRFARWPDAVGASPLAREYPIEFRTMKSEETTSADSRGSDVIDDFDNEAPVRPEIRAAFEPTCCDSDCADCPF